MKTLAEVFKKPEMKDVVVQQNLAQLDMIYGKLYDRLQLDNSEKQDLKNLLKETPANLIELTKSIDLGESLKDAKESIQGTALLLKVIPRRINN
jgi:hypothetical protein